MNQAIFIHWLSWTSHLYEAPMLLPQFSNCGRKTVAFLQIMDLITDEWMTKASIGSGEIVSEICSIQKGRTLWDYFFFAATERRDRARTWIKYAIKQMIHHVRTPRHIEPPSSMILRSPNDDCSLGKTGKLTTGVTKFIHERAGVTSPHTHEKKNNRRQIDVQIW